MSLDITGKATGTATVAGDGSTTLTTKGYVDGLIPTVGTGDLTITQGGTQVGIFNANAAEDLTIDIAAPFSGSYNDLSDTPTIGTCLLYTSPSPRDRTRSRMPSSA